jgi:hypothetical protein
VFVLVSVAGTPSFPNSQLFMSTRNVPSWLTRLLQGLLGILGFYAAVRLLPRVLKSMTRRFLFGLIGEILLVALGLFLTRRATERPVRPRPAAEENGATPRANASGSD